MTKRDAKRMVCGMAGRILGVNEPERLYIGDDGEMLPPAEKMATVESVAQARELLAKDREQAFAVLQSVDEADLAQREIAAPWNPGETFALGRHLLHSIRHSLQHKGQLFYYLKLQGKPVNTGHLWGM